MNKHKSTLIFHFLLTTVHLTSSTKQWIENPSFDSPSFWDSGYLPCPQDQILFPESFQSAVILPPEIDTTAITFPADGAIIFHPDSKISFSSGRSNGRKCKNSDDVAEVKPTPARYWFDPNSWKEASGRSEVKPNAAVPHIERIPCTNETVRIAATGPLAIDMSDIRTLRVGQIEMAGSNVSKEFMEFLFKSEVGEAMFKFATQTKVEYRKEGQCGCHQPDVFWDYEWEVCKHVADLCEKPKCTTAILPFGHCCIICGVMMKVFVDKCDSSYKAQLTEMIERSLKQQEMQDLLSFHISFVDGSFIQYLQVVVVENGEYQENSKKFLQKFNETIDWGIFKSNKRELFTSGRPYNPNGFGAALLLMIGTLLVVLVFFALIFVRFVPENRIIPLPRWMHVRWYDFFQSPFVFARFDNNPATEGETAENVVIDVQQYNVSADFSKRTEGASTSFDNPMFVEGPSVKAAPPKDSDDEDNDDIPSREESLTDIDLGTEIEGSL